MKLVPVAIAVFYRQKETGILEVWTQTREDDGIYNGLLEFPGGGIEKDETPLEAVVREVQEEVGIVISPPEGRLMGIYSHSLNGRTILLNVFLFPDQMALSGKGKWLRIEKETLSSVYKGKIPSPNHQMIDDLYRSIYS
ncbi:MAG: NUDIX hydrolase [Bacteriovoracia bacterium]